MTQLGVYVMHASIMSQGGRIVIPSELREQLQFKQGDQLLMEIKDGVLVVTSKAQRIRQVQAEFQSSLPNLQGRSPVDELIAERRAEVEKAALETQKIRQAMERNNVSPT